MDRITLLLHANGESVHRIFLNREAVNTPTIKATEVTEVISLDAQSDAFKTLYTDFVNAAKAILDAKHPLVEEHFHNTKTISNDPYDATVTRKLVCNRVIDVIPGVEFQLPVIVRHYRNEVHIYAEIPDMTVVLRGTKDKKIVVQGQEVSEYQHFANMSKLYPESAIIDQQLEVEAAAGKFDRPAPQVVLPE